MRGNSGGLWIPNSTSRIPDSNPWIPDSTSWILEANEWSDSGYLTSGECYLSLLDGPGENFQ